MRLSPLVTSYLCCYKDKLTSDCKRFFISCTVLILIYKSMHIYHGFLGTPVRGWGLLYYFLSLQPRRTMTLVDSYVKRKRMDYFANTASIVFTLEASWVWHLFSSDLLPWKLLWKENLKGLNSLTSVPCWRWGWCRNPGTALCPQGVQGDPSIPGALGSIELASLLPSLIRRRSKPDSGHESIRSVPVKSLMKYLCHLSGCQLSTNCSWI